MNIDSTLTNSKGEVLRVHYAEEDPLEGVEDVVFQAVHAFCFCEGQLVLVKHPVAGWMPPGGGIEPGESYEEAVVREVREETNMRVIKQTLIGYQDIYEPSRVVRQTRSVCIVEPYGPFVPGPEEEITEISLIDPEDARQYFDWGIVGDRVLARGLELKKGLESAH